MLKKIKKLPAEALCNKLAISQHIIYSEKLSGSVRLLLLADLHSTSYGVGQRELIGRIERLRPDAILISGDLIDERRSFKCVADLLRGIVSLAPVYFITGNHEHRILNLEYFLERMRKIGVNILQDEAAAVKIAGERLIIAGIHDPAIKTQRPDYSQKAAMQSAFLGLDEYDGIFKILLAHRPGGLARYAKYPFDLILSGHEHGGQVRIPFADIGLYAHGEIFPKRTAGLHELGKSKMIISRGLSIFAFPPRIFNPPEIVQIILKKAD